MFWTVKALASPWAKTGVKALKLYYTTVTTVKMSAVEKRLELVF